jgi:hypothetical protein
MDFRGSSAVSPQGANYRALKTYNIYGYISRRLIWIIRYKEEVDHEIK